MHYGEGGSGVGYKGVGRGESAEGVPQVDFVMSTSMTFICACNLPRDNKVDEANNKHKSCRLD